MGRKWKYCEWVKANDNEEHQGTGITKFPSEERGTEQFVTTRVQSLFKDFRKMKKLQWGFNTYQPVTGQSKPKRPVRKLKHDPVS